MKNKVIAFLESRLADHVGDLIRRRGGVAFSAPALAEEADLDLASIARLIDEWPMLRVRLAIFQTGVGTRALFAATDALGLTPRFLQLLATTTIAVRGPKPTVVLRQRGVRIDRSAAEPFTTVEVMRSLEGIDYINRAVVVQRYGATNTTLIGMLTVRDGVVIEIPTYRWALPADTTPLLHLMDALDRAEVDAVVFTSASQVANLFALAQQMKRADVLRLALNATRIASIGPVCSDALRHHGIHVDIEARPPKLGPLLDALDAALR